MAAETAAALMLAVGAGLLLRSVVQLTKVELGFRTGGVLTFAVRLPETRYRDQAARALFFEELERRVGEITGIQSVAFADAFPMRGGRRARIVVDGDTTQRNNIADFQVVSPGYFATLGIPAVRGRLPGADDRSGAEPAAVVSEAFVRRFLAGDPIGRRFRLGDATADLTVVGTVHDVRRDGKQAALTPQVHLAAAQTALYTAPCQLRPRPPSRLNRPGFGSASGLTASSRDPEPSSPGRYHLHPPRFSTRILRSSAALAASAGQARLRSVASLHEAAKAWSDQQCQRERRRQVFHGAPRCGECAAAV
jgi:hypothetical protein